MCTYHLANKHLQHLITMKIAKFERIDKLNGKCEGPLELLKKLLNLLKLKYNNRRKNEKVLFCLSVFTHAYCRM